MEKSEPLMTADGFYEKNVGSVSFFMRVASRRSCRGDTTLNEMAFSEERVPMINVRAGLITPTTRAFAAVELMLCVRVMAQEVVFPWFSIAYSLKELKTA